MLSTTDKARIERQYDRVFSAMSDGEWRTLNKISEATNAPEPSVSARLRDARKDGHTVLKRRVPGGNGLHEYKLMLTTSFSIFYSTDFISILRQSWKQVGVTTAQVKLAEKLAKKFKYAVAYYDIQGTDVRFVDLESQQVELWPGLRPDQGIYRTSPLLGELMRTSDIFVARKEADLVHRFLYPN